MSIILRKLSFAPIHIPVVLTISFAWLIATAGAQDDPPLKEAFVVRVSPHKENVVASELLGQWASDQPISDRLGGRSDHVADGRLAFRKSPQAEKRILAFLKKVVARLSAGGPKPESRTFLEAVTRIYLAGEVEFDGKKQDFALISLYGTPRLIFYDRGEDLESENVMLARDKDGDNDLLFLGGDFNNQSFGAFKRIK